MTTEWVSLYGQQVCRDVAKPWRWFNAVGPDVTKWTLNPNDVPLAASDAISGYKVVAVGTSPITLVAGAEGGALLFTSGTANTPDGVQAQAVTEGFYFAQKWPCYFGCCVQGNDVDQTAWFLGLGITDDTSVPTNSDNVSFRTADESSVLTFVTEKNDLESTAAVATLVDATDITLEWFYDGATVTAYVNGTEVASVADSSSTWPNDEYLAPTLAMLSGEASANTLQIVWARAIQIRQTS